MRYVVSPYYNYVSFDNIHLINGNKIMTWDIKDSPFDYQRGLSGIKELDLNKGALFFFKEDVGYSYWSKNTFLDLNIALFDKNGYLVEKSFLKAQDDNGNYQIFVPSVRYRYLLEYSEFDFELKKGDRLF